jgi:hypothetical protein
LQKRWTITREKCHLLLNMNFFVKEVTNLTPNFTWKKSCFVSSEWYQKRGGLVDKSMALGSLNVSRYIWAQCSVHRHIQRKRSWSIVSLDICICNLVACEFWMQVIHLGFVNRDNLPQNFATRNRKRHKTSKWFQTPPAHFFTPWFCLNSTYTKK